MSCAMIELLEPARPDDESQTHLQFHRVLKGILVKPIVAMYRGVPPLLYFHWSNYLNVRALYISSSSSSLRSGESIHDIKSVSR